MPVSIPAVPGLTSPLTAADYGDRYGLDANVVVVHVRSGALAGARVGKVWYAEDVPPPASLLASREPLPISRETPRTERAGREPTRPLAVRYTSQTYVSVLMGLLAVMIAADVVSFALSPDGDALRGVGTRVFVVWALHTRHRWARRAVYLWAGTLTFAGAVGLSVLVARDGADLIARAPAALLFAGMLVCGVFYVATVHRVIRIEPEADPVSMSLDDIGREARLD